VLELITSDLLIRLVYLTECVMCFIVRKLHAAAGHLLGLTPGAINSKM
jgi:hypothetical protein